MSTLHFTKLSATGNDFILFDGRDLALPGDLTSFFRRLCQRRTGVGADGILLIESSPTADFRMRYFNADGRESEMCGNGARAAAYYAARRGIAPPEMRFEVSGHEYHAEVEGNLVRLRMQPPRDLRVDLGVLHEKDLEEGGFVDTGVPHFVIFADDIDRIDVTGIGRKYRHDPAFQPRGTNVDFVKVVSPHSLRVRTYERGVEAETLACGTGVTAAAVIADHLHRVEFPVTIEVLGGRLRLSRGPGDAPVLEGTVDHIYDGDLVDLDK